jgi:hypothetical protein
MIQFLVPAHASGRYRRELPHVQDGTAQRKRRHDRVDPSASRQPSAELLPLICLKRWPSLGSPIRPAGPPARWVSNLAARQFCCVRHVELGAPSIHICLGHHERLIGCSLPAELDPL